jgi:hypothetical protein
MGEFLGFTRPNQSHLWPADAAPGARGLRRAAPLWTSESIPAWADAAYSTWWTCTREQDNDAATRLIWGTIATDRRHTLAIHHR